MTKKSIATKEWRRKFKERDPEGYKLYRRDEARKYRQNPEVQEKNRQSTRNYLIKNPNYSKEYKRAIKKEVIAAYGGKCQCVGCDITNFEFLTIDHIYGDGAEERRRLNSGGGVDFYLYLKQNNWPKDRYRLLCWNCNSSRGVFGYCPHELK